MTSCNYCKLKAIRARAAESGDEVTLKKERLAPYFLEGVNCYAHKPGEEIDHEKHFVAWFAALPDHCLC